MSWKVIACLSGGETGANLALAMNHYNTLHQVCDWVWQVRARNGSLLAVITWDEEFGNYYASQGDAEAEHFRTLSEAAEYAEVAK